MKEILSLISFVSSTFKPQGHVTSQQRPHWSLMICWSLSNELLVKKLVMMESNSCTFKRSHLIRASSTLHHGLRAQKEWLQCLKPHLNSKETKWKRAHLEAPKIIPNKVTWEIMLSILGKGWLSSKDPINRKGNKALSSLSQKVHAFKGFSKDRTL